MSNWIGWVGLGWIGLDWIASLQAGAVVGAGASETDRRVLTAHRLHRTLRVRARLPVLLDVLHQSRGAARTVRCCACLSQQLLWRTVAALPQRWFCGAHRPGRYDPVLMTGNALMRMGNRFQSGGPMVGTVAECPHTDLTTSLEIHRWRNQYMQQFTIIVKVLPGGQAVKFGVLHTYPIHYIYFQFRTLAGAGATRVLVVGRFVACAVALTVHVVVRRGVDPVVQREPTTRWSCCYQQRSAHSTWTRSSSCPQSCGRGSTRAHAHLRSA